MTETQLLSFVVALLEQFGMTRFLVVIAVITMALGFFGYFFGFRRGG